MLDRNAVASRESPEDVKRRLGAAILVPSDHVGRLAYEGGDIEKFQVMLLTKKAKAVLLVSCICIPYLHQIQVGYSRHRMEVLQCSNQMPSVQTRPQTQARERRALDACLLMATDDGVIRYLGAVCRERREAADKMIVEVCARIKHDFDLRKTEGALSRFERGDTTPTYLDAVIEGYARETEGDLLEFWADALEAARLARSGGGGARAEAAAALDRELAPAARKRAQAAAKDAPGKSAARQRRAS